MTVFHILPQFHFVNEHTIIGGYPSAVARLAAAQASQGYDVQIVSRMPESSVSEFADVTLTNLEVVDTKSHRHPLRFARQAVSFLKGRIAKGDLIHVHSGHAEYAVVSAIISQLLRVRVFHTLYCPVQRGLRGFAQRSAIILAQSSGVSFSGMTRNVCASIPVRSTWTPPVVDFEYFKSALNHERGCQFVFVGNATPSKGLTDLLSAFTKLVNELGDGEEISLVVTTELQRTSVSDELRKTMENLQDLPEFSRITWLSIVSDMRKLLAESAVHVAPFRNTNGPSDYFMSTLEAMAMGKVCVVSDLPGMAEVIKDGENGFSFRVGDINDLERALRRAIECDRIAVGRRAREFVTSTFGESAVSITNNIYGDTDA